jgi:hypothetical protein
MKDDPPLGFVVDEMLWKLGRFLRIAGFDVSIPRPTNDDELARISVEENRILLTRDKDLSNRVDSNSFRIIGDELKVQLMEIKEGIDLEKISREGSRCPACGSKLESRKKSSLSKEEEKIIPGGVLANQTMYYLCFSCGRIYWKGVHWEEISSILGGLNLLPDLD